MFSSARDVLERAVKESKASSARDGRETMTLARRRVELNRDDDVEIIDADAADAAADAKRRRVALAEAKSLAAKSKPKQQSLADAWRAGMMGERRGSGSAASSSATAGGVSRDVLQRVLAYAPASQYTDARLVCKAWRDAVDDEAFLPMLKLNRSLAVGDEETRANARARIREATGRRCGDVGLAPLVEHIATNGGSLFKTMLDVESFRRCVEEDEHLSGARALERVSTTDETYWRDVETATSRSFLGTVGDVSATIRELATFVMVQTRTNATTTHANGWAVLALAMTHVAENEFVASRLLRAARRALRRQRGSDFAEEDVTEFMNLLIAFVRSGPSWRDGDAAGEDSEIAREYRRIKARLTAALDYANLQDERDWSGNLPGARGMPGLLQTTSRLTREQEAIVSTTLKPPQWMVVHAFAGSGKTTTLVEYAKRNPSKRFLYLAFNRAITEEAKKRFPVNTDAKTFHGLAYGLANWYKAGGKKIHFGDKLRSSEVCKALGMKMGDRFVGRGLVTLNNYLVSADDDIGAEHVPAGTTDSVEKILDVARRLWTMMKVRSSNDVPMTHAGYMKMYQLQRPRLDIDMSKNKKKTGYDVILLDEAQDIAPVMFDIVLRQENCAKILVGDAHQQIYNFTGAMNVMNKIHSVVPRHMVTHRRLVRSFRFGLEIANVANAILNVKRENDALLIGSKETRLTDKCVFMTKNIAAGEASTLGAFGNLPPELPVMHVGEMSYDRPEGASSASDVERRSKREQVTVLVRSNSSLVCALFYLLTAKEDWPNLNPNDPKTFRDYEYARSTRVHIVGGVEALKLNQVLDFARLIHEVDMNLISDRYIRMFLSYGGGNASLDVDLDAHEGRGNALSRIVGIAQHQDDFETLNRIRIAQRYGMRLFAMVPRLAAADVGANAHAADFIVTTAHKSKGLEFDNVMLWDDFEKVDRVQAIKTSTYKNGARETSVRYYKKELTDFGEETVEVPVDEINLAYVAVTRARKRVFLNASLARLLLFPAQPLADDERVGRADPSRHFEHAWRLNDHGFAPYVLRHVDLPADEKPNRLHWNPALSAFGRGDACQKCARALDATNAFVLPSADARRRTDGLVCVGDRGVELRNVDPFHEGVFEDAPARRLRAADVGHVRLDVDRRYHRARDAATGDHLPGIFVFENPPSLFRARVCRDCFDPDADPGAPGVFAGYGRRHATRAPLFHTIRRERRLRESSSSSS